MTSLTLQNLGLHYPGSKLPSVEGLNLDVEDGSFLALLGPSGCGKTSTLKMIAGLLSPTSGDIRFDGKSVLTVAPEKRAVAMVFQNDLLFPYMNIRDNIGFGLRMRKYASGDISSRVMDIMERVQITDLALRKPHEISGGQRQRAALARALITQPDLLLLDEPLSSLDAHLRDEMRSLILDLQRQSRITTIMVTHDQQEALQVADNIALIIDGRLRQQGKPQVFFDQPVDRTCARFFGGKNFLKGRLEKNRFHCALGTLQLADFIDPTGNRADQQNSSHANSMVTIRPENIEINPKPGLGNRFSGRIVNIEYRGTHGLITVCPIDQPAAGDHKNGATAANSSAAGNHLSDKQQHSALLHIHCHPQTAATYQRGDDIEVGLPPQALWLLPLRD